MTSWTVGLSVCTANSCSLRDVNTAVAAALQQALAASNEVNIVIQNITGIGADGKAVCQYTTNGIVDPHTTREVLGTGAHLKKLVEKMAGFSSTKSLLWVISHGGTTGARVKVSKPTGDITVTIETVTTDPTQHRPIASGSPLVALSHSPSLLHPLAGHPAPAPLQVSRTTLYAEDYGKALSSANLDVVFIQSCQAGGLDLLDQLFLNTAAQHFVGSAANLPLPGPEVSAIASFLKQTPAPSGEAVAKRIGSEVVASLATPNPLIAANWPATTDASPFAARGSDWAAFDQAFRRNNLDLAQLVQSNAVAKDDIKAWLADPKHRTEIRASRVAINDWIGWLAQQQWKPNSTAQFVATHDQLFHHLPAGGSGAAPRSAGLSTAPSPLPTGDFFERSEWNSLLAKL